MPPMELMASLEVFNCSPQPLKAGIVATAVFRKFMEFNMYSQRCIIAGTVVACSVCVLELMGMESVKCVIKKGKWGQWLKGFNL